MGREPESIQEMFAAIKKRKREDNGDRSFPYHVSVFGGPQKYGSEDSKVSVKEFDESLAEWKGGGVGAPHVGGIPYLNPEYIWYYDVYVDGEVKLQYKIIENSMEEEMASFFYYTSKKEFYLYNHYRNFMQRVVYKK